MATQQPTAQDRARPGLSMPDEFIQDVHRTAEVAEMVRGELIVPGSVQIAATIKAIASQAVQSIPSPNTRRVYMSRLIQFIPVAEKFSLTRDVVLGYVNTLREGQGESAANQAISAIKLLVRELDERSLMDRTIAQSILSIRSHRAKGVRTGNWLSLDECRSLIAAARTARDRALIAVMIGCGLRREEASQLTWGRIQVRFDRPVFSDIIGKGRKIRSIGIPEFAYRYLLEYSKTVEMSSGKRIFPLTSSGIWYVIGKAAKRAGIDRPIAPHDLRRTMAALAKEYGADLRQIQADLGHSSIQTTERYLGAITNLKKSSGDSIPL